MIESDLGVLGINKLDLWSVPGDVGFWEDNQVRFIRGCFADESDGFGDSRFGVEEYWGDVAGCMTISTAILRIYVVLLRGLDQPATLTLGSHDLDIVTQVSRLVAMGRSRYHETCDVIAMLPFTTHSVKLLLTVLHVLSR